MSKGYWQVPVAEADIAKTAFITPDGSYEFLKMLFGKMNSGVTLVRGMKKVLYGMHNVDGIVDDILVHTTTLSEHVCLLKDLFQKLQKAKSYSYTLEVCNWFKHYRFCRSPHRTKCDWTT